MKLCVLVIIGVNERGEKHFLAIEDGVQESTQSWREVLWTRNAKALHEAAGGSYGLPGPPANRVMLHIKWTGFTPTLWPPPNL